MFIASVRPLSLPDFVNRLDGKNLLCSDPHRCLAEEMVVQTPKLHSYVSRALGKNLDCCYMCHMQLCVA